MRIVSLLPSATEVVADLGFAHALVGRSAECDWPPEVRELPVVTASRVDTSLLAGAAIDDAVRAALAEGRSLYAVDGELLAELRPDVILTQDLCAVCAVSRTLGELCESILALARRLEVEERGVEVVTRFRRRLDAIHARVAGRPRPRVVVLEWLEPPFAPGHWVPEMVEVAGGECVLGRAGEPAYRADWDAVRAARPELVVAAPCGYDREHAAREAARCVPDLGCTVVAVDANATWSRCTPRVADGIDELAALLHPGTGEAAA
jgi:iron complex transport system substrate-binding protein